MALPGGVARIRGCQRLHNGKALAIGGQRGGEVALRELHVADPLVGHREIAPPAGVAGIGLRQAFGDREAVAVGGQRPGEVALRDLHVADLVVRH